MTDDVIRLPLNRVRLGFIAAGCVLPALFVLFFLMAMPADLRFQFSFRNIALWGALVGFGGLSTYISGIAMFTPHGLRLDADGVSGYYAPAPLKWSDIADIDLVRSGKTMVIGLRLHDRDAYWNRLTPVQRLFRLGQPSPFHASIPITPFALTEAELLALLRKYWWQHR